MTDYNNNSQNPKINKVLFRYNFTELATSTQMSFIEITDEIDNLSLGQPQKSISNIFNNYNYFNIQGGGANDDKTKYSINDQS